jgi:hypothetical protein
LITACELRARRNANQEAKYVPQAFSLYLPHDRRFRVNAMRTGCSAFPLRGWRKSTGIVVFHFNYLILFNIFLAPRRTQKSAQPEIRVLIILI